MATKAERKAQARAERIAREEAAAAAAVRRRRLLRVGAGLLVAVAAVAIAIAAGSSGGQKTPTSAAPQTVNRLLAGIPQAGNRLGRASAPVTVTVYEDLECPVCREFALGGQAQLIANDVRSGRAKLVFRSLQTATPDAATFQTQQAAAAAAGKQRKLWQFVELFYREQGQEGTGYVSDAYLDRLARQVKGLDYSAWLGARNSAAAAAQVSSDMALAQARRFNSTPTIVVQGPSASPRPVAGAVDYGTLANLIRQAGA
jgi:protein-disulfide isomerase